MKQCLLFSQIEVSVSLFRAISLQCSFSTWKAAQGSIFNKANSPHGNFSNNNSTPTASLSITQIPHHIQYSPETSDPHLLRSINACVTASQSSVHFAFWLLSSSEGNTAKQDYRFKSPSTFQFFFSGRQASDKVNGPNLSGMLELVFIIVFTLF